MHEQMTNIPAKLTVCRAASWRGEIAEFDSISTKKKKEIHSGNLFAFSHFSRTCTFE